MSSTARHVGCATLVLAVTLTFTASAAGAAKTSDPKKAKAVAALLAAKKLGCRDFASASRPSGGSSSLPASFSQLALLLQGADLGTCTVGGLRTLLVAFPNARARQSAEMTLAALPCVLVKSALSSTTGPTGGVSSGNIALPFVDLGSRAVAFSTGSAPDTDQLDLSRAATAASTIASKAKGKLRTLTYQCA
jgi:hypothetical protein